MWEGALNKLKNGKIFTKGTENEELWIKLKISYGYLDKQPQNMFLDIVCFKGGLKINGGISLKKCVTLSQIGSKGFHDLKHIDLA
jgi:hypothetical protein